MRSRERLLRGALYLTLAVRVLDTWLLFELKVLTAVCENLNKT